MFGDVSKYIANIVKHKEIWVIVSFQISKMKMRER